MKKDSKNVCGDCDVCTFYSGGRCTHMSEHPYNPVPAWMRKAKIREADDVSRKGACLRAAHRQAKAQKNEK